MNYQTAMECLGGAPLKIKLKPWWEEFRNKLFGGKSVGYCLALFAAQLVKSLWASGLSSVGGTLQWYGKKCEDPEIMRGPTSSSQQSPSGHSQGSQYSSSRGVFTQDSTGRTGYTNGAPTGERWGGFAPSSRAS